MLAGGWVGGRPPAHVIANYLSSKVGLRRMSLNELILIRINVVTLLRSQPRGGRLQPVSCGAGTGDQRFGNCCEDDMRVLFWLGQRAQCTWRYFAPRGCSSSLSRFV
eukprot:jgi/Botrbrau1/19148/Bobra.0077s0060.1